MGEILDRVVEDGSVDVLSLAQEFGVSAATVRRDLQALHHQGLLRRTHGVRSPDPPVSSCRCSTRPRASTGRSERSAWPPLRLSATATSSG